MASNFKFMTASLSVGLAISACLPKRKINDSAPQYTVTEANKDLKTRQELCEASHKEWKDERCHDLGVNLVEKEVAPIQVKDCTGAADQVWDGSNCVAKTKQKNFFRYCVDPSSKESIKLTIEVMREVLNKQTCQTAHESLISKKVLFLQGKKISNLEPLSGLSGLESLVLGNNEISDISALRDLVNLTYLDLYGNGVSDLAPLVKLSKLASLYLNGNPIENILPLAGLVKLNDLDLANTPFSAASFPKNPKNCPTTASSALVASLCKP